MAGTIGQARKRFVFLLFLFVLSAPVFSLPSVAFGTNLIRQSLCDERVLYIFSERKSIDWPTLYYLNEHFGCRVDLLTVRPAMRFEQHRREVEDREIYLHQFEIQRSDQNWFDSMATDLCRERRPDIVLLDGSPSDSLFAAVREHFLNLPHTLTRLFDIMKIYERIVSRSDTLDQSTQVVLNGNELRTRYLERMSREVPLLLPAYTGEIAGNDGLTRYRLLYSGVEKQSPEVDFLSGVSINRLPESLERSLEEGPRKEVLVRQAKEFVTSLTAALDADGKSQAELVLDAYRQLRDLHGHRDYGEALDSLKDFKPYLDNLLSKVERAALGAVGLRWNGKVIVRDSPHGPKVKLRVSLSADGPQQFELTAVRFHPYWDTMSVMLDSIPKTIMPHQSYVREYLIDLDRSRLETNKPESLLFTTEIAYGRVPLVLTRSLPLRKTPPLQIRFEPDFYFVRPVPDIEVDRVVSSMDLKVVITKPRSFTGTAHLNLEPPRGLFAGAYRQEIQLEKGFTHETVRIPFSISNLFELGVQNLTVTLTVDDKIVASDTGRVRIASSRIGDNVKIGFLPDSLGRLEDILRMTDADFRPLTDRSLLTAELDAYNVIIIGSGSFTQYPSLGKTKSRFEEYLRYGGSIIVMAQPNDWPNGPMPVSLTPVTELVNRSDITNKLSEAKILNRPYRISDNNLLSYFSEDFQVMAAVVMPAEKVYQSASGAALLSVTRVGDGQIIYCGFPLLEMIGGLEIDAIHLFANILNY